MMRLINSYKKSKAYEEGITPTFLFGRLFLLIVFITSYLYVSQFESCVIDYDEQEIKCKDILYREEGFSFNSFYYTKQSLETKRIDKAEYLSRVNAINNKREFGKLNINITNGN